MSTVFTRIDEAAAAKHRLSNELATHLAGAKREEARLRAEIQVADAAVRVGAEGFDLARIALAEKTLAVLGSYAKAGQDRASVVSDAIAQIATGEKQGYRGLWLEAFNTKDYAHWHGQRSDHEYGFGPKHGSIIFSVGLSSQVRQREVKELTDAEKDACVYYLTNLERIQAARTETVK
jgi:hypothetical protein